MLRRGPSLQPFVHLAAFWRLKDNRPDADALELEICELFIQLMPEINTALADAEDIQFWADERWERQALSHQTFAMLPLACGLHQPSPS